MRAPSKSTSPPVLLSKHTQQMGSQFQRTRLNCQYYLVHRNTSTSLLTSHTISALRKISSFEAQSTRWGRGQDGKRLDNPGNHSFTKAARSTIQQRCRQFLAFPESFGLSEIAEADVVYVPTEVDGLKDHDVPDLPDSSFQCPRLNQTTQKFFNYLDNVQE